jgi:hypothetical protein
MSKLYTSKGKYLDTAIEEQVLYATRAAIQQAIGATKAHAQAHPDVADYRQAAAALESLHQADLNSRNYPLEDRLINELEGYLLTNTLQATTEAESAWGSALREALEAWADLEDARVDNSRCQYCGLINGH